MTQKNRIVKKSRFIWVLIAIFVFSGVASAFAAPAQDSTADRNEATERLLAAARDANTSVEEVARLIQEGADVNATSRHGWALRVFPDRNKSSPGFLRVIIENGADVNTADGHRWTPLIFAAQSNSNPDVLRILVESGADVNAADCIGKTPLMHAACVNSNPDILRLLIEKGADVNAATKNGWTSLLFAAVFACNPSIVRILIENGANVEILNAVDNNGRSSLMLAIARLGSNPENIRVLIENGANVNAVDNTGKTALMLATERRSNPDYDFGILRVLIDNDADVNSVDNTGRSALMRAVERGGGLNNLRLLLENGADVNVADINGITPLMLFAKNHSLHHHFSRPDVLRTLIENGADVNAVDDMGRTPLIWAAERSERSSNHDVLRFLINNGADVGIRDKEGKRAIDFAEANGQLMQTYAFNLCGARIGGDVNLNLYHPWNGLHRLARLDSPASLRIYSDFPRIDGAKSVYPLYAAVASEIFAVSDKAELQQYLFYTGAEDAYNRLIQGEVDMIFVPLPSDEQLELAKNAGVDLHFTPIARDGFVFFVNRRNSVTSLTIEQIQNIFLNKITNWQEVGGGDREILPFQRPANSSSQAAMIEEVMSGNELPRPLIRRAILAPFRDREGSIGYSFHFFVEEMMRNTLRLNLLPIDERQSAIDELSPIRLLAVDGIAPTAENIRDGTYPFTVDVFAVTAGTSNPHVPKLIEWLLSPEGQELIERTGYVGVKSDRS